MTTPSTFRAPLAALRTGAGQRGFSLVELMVGIVISIICTLGMMAAFAAFESQKRTTSNGSDAQQNGSFSLYDLERQVRTAGAGLTQGKSWGVWGCRVNYTASGTNVLPAAAAPPPPFASWPTSVYAAPVLAQSGGADGSGNALPDTLQIVRGNSAVRTFKAVVTSTSGMTATVENAFGFNINEYVLLSDAGGTKGCTIGLISAQPDLVNDVLTLGPAGTPATGFVGKYVGTGYVFDLGPQPAFTLYGVDTTATSATYHSLMTYDLLNRGTTPLVPVADGIVSMKILYGVDDGVGGVADDQTVDEWVQPTGIWALSALTGFPDTTAAQTNRQRIKAVRIALVAQSKLPERAPASASSDAAYIGYVNSGTLMLFGDMPAALQFKITTDPAYRYKVYDTVIPVRNALVTSFF